MQKRVMSNSSRDVLLPVLLDSLLSACGSDRPTYAGRSQQVDVKAEIQRDYNQDLVRRFEKTVWTNGNCVSWYHTHAAKTRLSVLDLVFSFV